MAAPEALSILVSRLKRALPVSENAAEDYAWQKHCLGLSRTRMGAEQCGSYFDIVT